MLKYKEDYEIIYLNECDSIFKGFLLLLWGNG